MGEPSWNNGVVFPASKALTFTKRVEAVIPNSVSKSSILHLLCLSPSSNFSVEAVADGDVNPNSQHSCPGHMPR